MNSDVEWNEEIVKRDDKGRFKKGQVVPAPRRGRPSRTDSMPVLVAVAEQAYSAEQLVEMVRETYETARGLDDWKGMFTVIQFVVNYAVGKPVQRTLTANINPELIKEFFQGRDTQEQEDEDSEGGDDDVVDVDAREV